MVCICFMMFGGHIFRILKEILSIPGAPVCLHDMRALFISSMVISGSVLGVSLRGCGGSVVGLIGRLSRGS